MAVAYNRCLQISFIIVQILFICLGLIMIALGVWLEFLDQSFEAAIDAEQLLYGPYLIIAAGCGVVVVAAVGMVGACYDHKVNRVLLGVYIILVIIVFIAQTVGGVLAFVYRNETVDFVREGLNETLVDYGGDSNRADSITDAWDFVQETLECCGVNSSSNWEVNPNVMTYPDSCCPGSFNTSADPPCPEPFADGCEQALTDFIEQNLLIVAAVGITFVVAEVIVVLMAVCLLCCTDFDD